MKHPCHALPALLLIAALLSGCAQPHPPVRSLGKAANQAAPVSHVQVSGLNLRECPSTRCPVLAVLGRGERVTVLLEQNGWAEVRTQSGGKTGWVRAQYLGRRPPAPLKSDGHRPGKAPAVPEEEFGPASPGGQPPPVEEESGPAGNGGQDSQGSPPPVSEEFGK